MVREIKMAKQLQVTGWGYLLFVMSHLFHVMMMFVDDEPSSEKENEKEKGKHSVEFGKVC